MKRRKLPRSGAEMGVSVIGLLKFLITDGKNCSEYWRKHGANLNAAIKDALPLIERLRQNAMPESETAHTVEQALRKVEQTTRIGPNHNDPVDNYDRNAGG